MPQFDIYYYPSQIFWLILVFGALYAMIGVVVVPVVEKTFRNRDEIIGANINNAEDLFEKAKKLEDDYRNEINNISFLVETNKKNALLMVEASFDLQQKNLYVQLKESIDSNLKNLELERESFWSNGDQACISLAKNIIERITRMHVDPVLLEQCYGKVK